MDITQLRYFHKTVETMNFTRAAEALFTSRQALRQSLSALERELGHPLFRTERNRLFLTEYGAYLAKASADVLREFDAMEANVSQFFQHEVNLRFAFSVSLVPYSLPGLEQFVLRDFSHRFPHISLKTIPSPADKVIDLVETREVDCGCVLQMPTPRPGCEITVLRTSPVAVNFGKDSPLRDRPELTLEDLDGLPLIGMGDLEKIAKPLWEDCQKEGLTLDYRPVPDTVDALYRTKHNEFASLNTFPPNWTPERDQSLGHIRSILQGYTWELVFLSPKDSPNFRAAQLLTSYLVKHYLDLYAGPVPDSPWKQDLVL